MFDLIWPVVCAGCGVEGFGRLCEGCVPERVLHPSLKTEHLRTVVALDATTEPLGDALRSAKYGPDRAVMWAIAEAWSARMEPAVPIVEAIVPVPTHPLRQLSRGFSPAAILARALADATGLPILRPLRAAVGPRQASLDRAERQARRVGWIRAVADLSGPVLLVDDVVTTGSTADACARELLCAGATVVHLATVCATARRGDKLGDIVGHHLQPSVTYKGTEGATP